MPQMMQRKYVDVTNVSETRQRLTDVQLPNGELIFPPGAEMAIPADVFQRSFRRHSAWMIRTEKLETMKEIPPVEETAPRGRPKKTAPASEPGGSEEVSP
jgi:hypothetical protein